MKRLLINGMCSLALLMLSACNLPGAPTAPAETQAIPTDGATQTSQPAPSPSATAGQEAKATATEAVASKTASPVPPATLAPSATSGPECTTLSKLNLRTGPGTIYDIKVLLAEGSVLIPENYQAKGFPQDSWVRVLNPASNQPGWVNAGTNYVRCTIDLSTLPGADFPPTPTPSEPQVKTSQPKGTFETFTWKLEKSGSYLLRMNVFQGDGQKDGDNIASVYFNVKKVNDNTEQVNHTESNAPFCIFGGDDTCAPWPEKNGKRIWPNTGEIVESGDYKVSIDAESKDGNYSGSWNFTLTITNP
jgi:hypothetical protein